MNGFMEMQFREGVRIDISGPLRIVNIEDSYYVVGEGLSLPCHGLREAEEMLQELKTYLDQ